MYEVDDDVLLHGKQSDPKQSEHHQLHRADLTQHSTVGY